MENKILSIAIPTFNRPEILKDNILLMLPEIRELSIPIYISDDSLDDQTKNVIIELEKDYEHIYYSRNIPSLGHDSNIFYTLKFSKTDYVWLLGDCMILKRGAIKNALEIISQIRPQIIGVNAKNRDLDIDSAYCNDSNKVLDQFGWHLTLTGAVIYSRSVISSIDEIAQNEYKNFPQIALIFHHLTVACSFYWINDKYLYVNSEKESYWLRDVFEVFIDDWSNAIQNLPDCYGVDNKEKVILEHSRKVKLFDLRSLLKARYMGAYNVDLFKEYKMALADHSRLSSATLLMIAFIPKTILGIILAIKKYLSRLMGAT